MFLDAHSHFETKVSLHTNGTTGRRTALQFELVMLLLLLTGVDTVHLILSTLSPLERLQTQL